ncbi:hypothetical protein ONZ45_g16836 [Pleurotus djamor]|nr:hypothetical protein ONZ45_g16836 [Pleurotus djamor]
MMPNSGRYLGSGFINTLRSLTAFLAQRIEDGQIPHLVVQPEQLTYHEGRLPRLARLLRTHHKFANQIKRVNIDEAHFIHTAGKDQYGLSAFRPAWGRLDMFRVLLPQKVPFLAMSGTLPPHIKSSVRAVLRDNAVLIELTSNRPNIVYAARPILGAFTDWRNLNFVIPNDFNPDDFPRPKTIIFVDNTDFTEQIVNHLTTLLPTNLRSQGHVKKYHGKMSKAYLDATYDDFSNPVGQCIWLIATEGASTGLDVRGIRAVIQYGVTRDLASALQRGGRGGRDPDAISIFLTLYEDWVPLMSIPKVFSDPDQPVAKQLSRTSPKRDRTAVSVIAHFQSSSCQRDGFAQYMDDKTGDALKFVGPWCCDRHGSDFDLTYFFKGSPLLTEAPLRFINFDSTDQPATSTPKRPKGQRKALLRSVYTIDHIINVKGMELLSAKPASQIQTITNIQDVLNETDEWAERWGDQILNVIKRYDEELRKSSGKPARKKGKENKGTTL